MTQEHPGIEHEAQKQVLTERAIAFEKAKNSLIDLITEHMKSPIFKEKASSIVIQKTFPPEPSKCCHPKCWTF